MKLAVVSFALLGCLGLAPAAGAVVVHGLDHDALGSASVSSIVTSDGQSCAVSNLDDSGDDGVSISLAQVHGVSVRFGPPPVLPSDPIDGCTLELRHLVGGAPSVIGSCDVLRVGGNLTIQAGTFDASEAHIDIWDGSSLLLSATRPATTVITIAGSNFPCDEGTSMSMSAERTSRNGGTLTYLWVQVEGPRVPMTVDGMTFTGDRVVYRFELTVTDPVQCSDARLTVRGSLTTGTASSISLISENVLIDPFSKSGVPKPGSCAVTGESGVTITAGTMPGELHIQPDGSSDHGVLALKGGRKADDDVIDFTLRLSPLALDGTAFSKTLSVDCEFEGGGLPPSTVTESVHWTSSAPAFATVSNAPASGHEMLLDLYDADGQWLASSSSSSYTCNAAPIECRASCENGLLLMSLGFPPGTSITVDGTDHSGVRQGIFIVRATPVPGPGSPHLLDDPPLTARRISDIRIVHPPATPPGRYQDVVSTRSVVRNQHFSGTGRDLGARGPRQSVSLEGSYLRLSNMSSAADDGVEIELNGLTSSEVGFPVPVPGSSSPEPVLLELEAHPCDDGSCAPSSRLECLDCFETSATAQLGVTCASQGSSPLYLHVPGQAYGRLAIADLDGDGRADLVPVSPSSSVRIAKVRYRWHSPTTEVWELYFREQLAVHFENGEIPTDRLFVWRNRDGVLQGSPSPTPRIMSLNGLPPGATIGGSLGVCSMTIEPPGLQVAGCSVGRPFVSSTLAGQPVLATWATVSGPINVTSGEVCDDSDYRSTLPVAIGTDWTYSGSPTLRAIAELPTGGFVVVGDFPSLGSYSSPSTISLSISGTSFPSLARIWDVGLHTGGPAGSSIEMRNAGSGAPAFEWTVYKTGVQQTQFTGDGPLPCSALCHDLVLSADLDGDGIPTLELTSFPDGSVVVVGGFTFECDRVVVRRPTVVQSGFDDCVVSLEAMPPGVPVTRLRLAAIPGPGYVTVGPVPLASGAALALSAAAPNPFAAVTTLQLALRDAGHVRAGVFDVGGREVARLANARFEAGEHLLRWNGRTHGGAWAAAGLYFVRVEREGVRAAVMRVTRLR